VNTNVQDQSRSISLSFEVFPPKTDEGLAQLTAVAGRLAEIDPTFVSVTYGAGGSHQARSFEAIEAVAGSGLAVAGHVTCVGQSTAAIDDVLGRYEALGVSHVVVLRGDPPEGVDAAYRAHPEGFQSTADLVAAAAGRFDVFVSAYPERHPQSPSVDHDLDVLAAKVAAGATRAITQMVFDNDAFLRYRDRVASRRIPVDVVPGIFPIHSFPAVSRFAERCGSTIPSRIADRFQGLDDDEQTAHKIAAELAAEQIDELARHGVSHAHVFTLNRADLVLDVVAQLA
jgi:methylenetetrahydrofolate reductase (NADPH)